MAVLQDFSVDTLDGSGNLIPELQGKVVLAVNVASKCGLTPQYEALQALHEELKAQGFTVAGFPCNQFGAQEPGTPDEIKSFCSTSYGVDFPMSCKIEVNGASRHPVYAWLTDPDGGFSGDIEWNFEKFLIDREGKVVRRYPPATAPEDTGLRQDVVDLL